MNAVATELSDSIDDAIAGKVAGSGTQNIYSAADDDAGTYTRNSNLFMGIDLSFIPAQHSAYAEDELWALGALISPRHFLTANHMVVAGFAGGPYNTEAPGGGSTPRQLRFVAMDGTVVTRTTTNGAQVGETDFWVGLLDSDVPSNIRFAKVLPPNYQNIVEDFLPGIPCCICNQFRKLSVCEWIPFEGEIAIYDPAFDHASRSSWYTATIEFDSGSPLFAVFQSQPVLISTLYSTFTQPDIGLHILEINDVMTSLGGGYQLTPISFDLLVLANQSRLIGNIGFYGF